MKRTDLIRKLGTSGCSLVRHDGKHDWYRNPRTAMSQPAPRYNEVNETVAKHILRRLAG
jgi:predicted RNA binding protein YcfA (HicA-like mRNA interferase family)